MNSLGQPIKALAVNSAKRAKLLTHRDQSADRVREYLMLYPRNGIHAACDALTLDAVMASEEHRDSIRLASMHGNADYPTAIDALMEECRQPARIVLLSCLLGGELQGSAVVLSTGVRVCGVVACIDFVSV
eukprot:CAMPEP_0115827834 /NCGR_PEP_ID=MMETSP0287-20121206/255_1 /TAXON_ID=412157 /ORGANISM="Chrysochromulina rotalis, Strain UIO044" /LENGTH=130 /DNA_ID=CAMNT_0003281017 /DNA_START=1315 /DNA_END=1707 /DNA_ORIENTATION=+